MGSDTALLSSVTEQQPNPQGMDAIYGAGSPVPPFPLENSTQTLSLHSNTEIHWNTRHGVKREHGARGQMPGFKSTSVLVI